MEFFQLDQKIFISIFGQIKMNMLKSFSILMSSFALDITIFYNILRLFKNLYFKIITQF